MLPESDRRGSACSDDRRRAAPNNNSTSPSSSHGEQRGALPPRGSGASSAPATAIPTHRIKKTLKFSTPEGHSSDAPTRSSESCSSSDQSSESQAAQSARRAFAVVPPSNHLESAPPSEAKPRTAFKQVKSRYLTSQPSPQPRRAFGDHTSNVPEYVSAQQTQTGSKAKDVSEAPKPLDRLDSKENGPNETAAQLSETQADLRARLAAFREGKKSSAKASAPPQAGSKPPLPALADKQSANMQPRKGYPTRKDSIQTPSQPHALVASPLSYTSNQAAATPSESDAMPYSKSPETPEEGSGVTADSARLPAGEKMGTSVADFQNSIDIQAWKELQWHYLNRVTEDSLSQQKSQAEKDIADAADMVSELTKRVAEKRIEADALRASMKLERAMVQQLPDLRGLHSLQAVLKAALQGLADTLEAAMLHVPVSNDIVLPGSSAGGHENALLQSMKTAEEVVGRLLRLISFCLGNSLFAAGSAQPDTEAEQAVAKNLMFSHLHLLSSACQDMLGVSMSEVRLVKECTTLLSQLQDLNTYESSLLAHIDQIKTDKAPLLWLER